MTEGPRWILRCAPMSAMDFSRLLESLASDFARLRAIAPIALTAQVPSCPGWSVTDLTRHVGEVYLHKTLAMREGAEPDPWPPSELADGDPLVLLDRAYAGLIGEFAAHKPEDAAGSWYAPDQTVGFYIRRMAQETVIHRIDAELATGQPVAAVPDDLAIDGIDELLKVFVAYSVAEWSDSFTDILPKSLSRTCTVHAGRAVWQIRTGPGAFVVTDSAVDGVADATVSGAPAAVLRWLWNREDANASSAVIVEGAQDAVEVLRGCITTATQ